MLFSPKDILPPKEPIPEPKTIGRRSSASVQFVKPGTAISAAITHIEDGFSYHIPCFVNWSLHDVLERLLELTGPAHVCLTSWAISEGPARKIANLLKDGKILSLHCLFDHRVTRYCPAAMQLVQGQMGKIKLTGIHAKILVIENENWGISVTSTANATNKRRIEKYVITCDREVAEFERLWITKQINR
jgi:hypothetical protein